MRCIIGIFIAFMVAWNLWVFAISILAGIGLVVTTNISYAIGPSAAWIKDHKLMITLVSCVLVFGMVAAATRGLAVGKWVHNAGGVMLMLTFGALILLPVFAMIRGSVTDKGQDQANSDLSWDDAFNIDRCAVDRDSLGTH